MSETRDTANPPIGNSPSEDQQDLRSLLIDITREQTKSPDEGVAPKPTAGGEGAAQPATPEGGERRPGPPERGPDGRFRAGEQRPEPPAEPAGEPPPAEGDKPTEKREPLVPPVPGAPEPARDSKGAPIAPEHWSAGDKAQFGQLSSDKDREIFLGMYKRMEAGYTPRLQRGAQLERDYGDLDQVVFTPAQRQIIESQGRKPNDIVKIWHQVELRLGSKQHQAECAARIIHNYGIDTGQVAGYLNQFRGYPADPSGRSAQPVQPQPHPDGYDPYLRGQAPQPAVGNGRDPATGIHPAIAARLDALEADKATRLASDTAAHAARVDQEIFEFANQKDAEGNLLHPFFADLEGDMMQLAYTDRLARKQPVVKDLYERALWGNPVYRDKQLALQRQAEERQAAADRKAKTEAARHAGSSITGAPRSGQLPNSGQPQDQSIRDSIMAARNAGNSGGRI